MFGVIADVLATFLESCLLSSQRLSFICMQRFPFFVCSSKWLGL